MPEPTTLQRRQEDKVMDELVRYREALGEIVFQGLVDGASATRLVGLAFNALSGGKKC